MDNREMTEAKSWQKLTCSLAMRVKNKHQLFFQDNNNFVN